MLLVVSPRWGQHWTPFMRALVWAWVWACPSHHRTCWNLSGPVGHGMWLLKALWPAYEHPAETGRLKTKSSKLKIFIYLLKYHFWTCFYYVYINLVTYYLVFYTDLDILDHWWFIFVNIQTWYGQKVSRILL